MKKQKGFTLIELLAVIVILAIIALIIVPVILNMISKARKSAAKDSALGYIDSINYNNELASMNSDYGLSYPKYLDDTYDIDEISIQMKGKQPTSGTVTILNGRVSSLDICISGYNVTSENGKDVEVKEKCESGPSTQPVSFSTDSWSTIKANTTSNKYHVGDEKEVEIDGKSYTVRIVNKSTPSECNTTGFSQTACGLVIEFVDLVGERKMNATRTNAGGWKETDMVVYLNGDFYNSLPVDLKNEIKSTYPIVSGSGEFDSDIEKSGVSENITSSDTTKNKIYLLSAREVGFELTYDNKKNITTDTRVLDYYSTHNDNNSRIKKDLSGEAQYWWLRSAYSDYVDTFYSVNSSGSNDYNNANNNDGFAPAFRIGS